MELSRRKIARTQVLDIAGHGVMGACASLSLEALASADYSPASYEAGRFRMVEVLLMNMNIARALEEQRERLRRQGYNL